MKKAKEILDVLSSDIFKKYSVTAINSKKRFYGKVSGYFGSFFQSVENILKENEKLCGTA